MVLRSPPSDYRWNRRPLQPSPPVPTKPLCSRRTTLAATLALLASCTSGTDTPSPQHSKGRVLLLRGLMNIFSTGMNDLGSKLIDAGYAASVHNHTEWYALAEELAEQARDQRLSRPLGVAGHSLGGDDAIRLTTALGKEGIPVDLLITFDPVMTGTVPVGPRQVMNFFQTTGLWGRALGPGPGFDGTIENIPINSGLLVNHFNIEKDPMLHARVLARLETMHQGVVARTCPLAPRAGLA